MRDSATGRKYLVLRDGGFGPALLLVFGVPFGFILDFIWNWIALWIATSLVPDADDRFDQQARLYSLIITIVGALIDWHYFRLTWRMDLGAGVMPFVPLHSLSVQLILLLSPIVLLAAANFALCVLLLSLGTRKALIVAILMGILTAPWVLVFFPYVIG